ncbi:MAG TPA: hypothetical protein VFJ65_05550 [Solirubrobacterales bacterium]|nr:hypothetical protein [Solirubrobacterales bacterium]
MATVAVFLLLAGATAVAATQLGKNSVGSKQLKKNAVTTSKIKNGAVTGAKIKPGSVTGSNINLSSLGTVPSAANASHAASADSAAQATSPGTLGSGQTETGSFYIVGNGGKGGGFIGTAISFPFPLSATPSAHYMSFGEEPTPACPGSFEAPKAAKGQLCVYETMNYETTGTPFFDVSFLELPGTLQGVSPYGAAIAASTPATEGNSGFAGIWAVTGP